MWKHPNIDIWNEHYILTKNNNTTSVSCRMTLYALYRSAARFALSIGKKPQIIYTCTRNVRERRSHPRRRPTTIRNPQSQTTTNFREFLDAENEVEDESEDLDLADVVGGDEKRQWKELLTNVDLRDPDIIKDLYMYVFFRPRPSKV